MKSESHFFFALSIKSAHFPGVKMLLSLFVQHHHHHRRRRHLHLLHRLVIYLNPLTFTIHIQYIYLSSTLQSRLKIYIYLLTHPTPSCFLSLPLTRHRCVSRFLFLQIHINHLSDNVLIQNSKKISRKHDRQQHDTLHILSAWSL